MHIHISISKLLIFNSIIFAGTSVALPISFAGSYDINDSKSTSIDHPLTFPHTTHSHTAIEPRNLLESSAPHEAFFRRVDTPLEKAYKNNPGVKKQDTPTKIANAQNLNSKLAGWVNKDKASKEKKEKQPSAGKAASQAVKGIQTMPGHGVAASSAKPASVLTHPVTPDVAKAANEIVKAQGKKQLAAEKKANQNNKFKSSVEGAYRKAAEGSGFSKDEMRKNAKAAGDRAINQIQKDNKASRKAKWNVKVSPPQTKPAKNSKANSAAAQHLKESAQAMQSTEGIPHRKDKYPIPDGSKSVDGKDIRKAVFLSNVNTPNHIKPSGSTINKQGRSGTFNNDPYSPTHPDPSLRGQRPIPGLNPGKGKEYPVLSGSPSGWTGENSVGTARVITEDGGGSNGNNKLHAIIAHDKSRGGDPTDHYVVPKKP